MEGAVSDNREDWEGVLVQIRIVGAIRSGVRRGDADYVAMT